MLPRDTTSPWHPGEVALQTQAGVADRMAEVGPRVLRDHLINQHRAFYPLLPMVVLGAVDSAGDAWATVRAGLPGFMQARDAHHLHLALAPDPADPAEGGLTNGAALGLLGIDLGTRRRNRLNGTLHHTPDGFDLAVGQSFGNCPRYIQLRDVVFTRDPAQATDIPPVHMPTLDEAARRLIAASDTFFVASYIEAAAGRQVDVSHRGGRAGFVQVADDGLLIIPDFAGNLFFNTLGNILLNSRAGLVFVDFSAGDLLQMTGDAVLLSDTAGFEGAERLWTFRPRRIVRRPDALPLRWRFREWSPASLATGAWPATSNI